MLQIDCFYICTFSQPEAVFTA